MTTISELYLEEFPGARIQTAETVIRAGTSRSGAVPVHPDMNSLGVHVKDTVDAGTGTAQLYMAGGYDKDALGMMRVGYTDYDRLSFIATSKTPGWFPITYADYDINGILDPWYIQFVSYYPPTGLEYNQPSDVRILCVFRSVREDRISG